MKHTPGPWKAEHYNIHPHIEIWSDNGETNTRICYLQDHVVESCANANLLAAAPDLLNACKNIVWNRNDATVRLAMAAIAKAEGTNS